MLINNCRDKGIIVGNIPNILELVYSRCKDLDENKLGYTIVIDKFNNVNVIGSEGYRFDKVLGAIYMDKDTAHFIADKIKKTIKG